MGLRELANAAREKAAKAVAAARALGEQIREKQAKNESVGDLEAQFTKAHTDATASISEMNRLNAELELETQAERFTTPREQQRDPREATHERPRREERFARQHYARNREAFARAGITSYEHMARFRDAHADAFVPFVLEGPGAAMRVLEGAGFRPMEAFALLTTQGDLGGYLAPEEFRAEVLRDLAGFAVIRRLARVERTGSHTLVFPSIASASTDADIYSTGYTGAWRAEGYVTGGTAPTVQNQPTFGQSRIPVNAWAPNAVELTQELLQDSAANLESVLAEIIAETLALDEDAGFINGSGVAQPLGLLNTVSGTSITRVNSGHATALTYDGLIDLWTNVPAQYRQNARFLMASRTFGAVLKLKDGQGMPLFAVNQTPGTLWGKTIEFSEFMPEIAASTDVIIFGDFRYYGIADRQELRIQRLTERYAPNLGILPTARVGGSILRTAAFRKQYISA